MIFIKKKYSPLMILFTLFLLVGCSVENTNKASVLEVPSFISIDECVDWANKNDVSLRLIDKNGSDVDLSDSGSIIEISSSSVSPGETLEIIVYRVGEDTNTSTHTIIKDPPYPMK